jgi:hypothetical protein
LTLNIDNVKMLTQVNGLEVHEINNL